MTMNVKREISAEELKEIQLAILRNIAEFCDRHQIYYSLCGGTLLGAVRHRGFIPWDEDIDIFMPRPDYDRFIKTYNGYHPDYEVLAIGNSADAWSTFAKVYDLRTVLAQHNLCISETYHVFVDLFPVDAVPASVVKRKFFFAEQFIWHVIHSGSVFRFRPSKRYDDASTTDTWCKKRVRTIFKYLAIALFRWVPTSKIVRLIDRRASRLPYEKAEYVAAFIAGHYAGEQEVMPKALFEKRRKMMFEDCAFWVTEAWDLYLTNLYGDYMTPPPKENQVSHHDFTAYWKE